MANALRDPEVTETAKFVEMFDKLFDCTNFTAGKKARKPFQEPWRREDFMFKVSLVCVPFLIAESTVGTLYHISVAGSRISTISQKLGE